MVESKKNYVTKQNKPLLYFTLFTIIFHNLNMTCYITSISSITCNKHDHEQKHMKQNDHIKKNNGKHMGINIQSNYG